jgi:hypothetical protein
VATLGVGAGEARGLQALGDLPGGFFFDH